MMDYVDIKLLPCKEWKSFGTLSPKTNSITLQLFMLSRIQNFAMKSKWNNFQLISSKTLLIQERRQARKIEIYFGVGLAVSCYKHSLATLVYAVL